MTTSAEASVIEKALLQRRLPSGGWSFFSSEQASVEATCLAGLALGSDSHGNAVSTVRFLKKSQLSDGGWPAFQGDSEGAWTTALALCALTVLNEISDASNRALRWLLEARGKEGHWFWRWKFKTADRYVRFDPDKYGWPWSHGTGSWVIPTAFSVVAIKKSQSAIAPRLSEQRIHPWRRDASRSWVPPTVIDIANAPIPIQVLVQSPADTETDMQVICLFRSSPVNTMHGAGRMASNVGRDL